MTRIDGCRLLLDVGGTFIKEVLAYADGNFVPGSEDSVPINSDGTESQIRSSLNLALIHARNFASGEGMQIARVAVAIPGPFNFDEGIFLMKHKFASVFGKAGSLIRLDCRSLEYKYFPFNPEAAGYKLVLLDSVVKHELASSAYNKRRQSCEHVVAAIKKRHPEVEFLRDATMEMLAEVKAEVSEEDYMRAEYVIEEVQRVLDVCDALEKGDYETVGEKMYGTHYGMSKLYEVSCEELDFLNDIAKECGVTGSRVMG